METALTQSVPQSNTLLVLKDELAMEALGTNVIIKEDRFKSGNECKRCDGLGFLDEVCRQCEGTKEDRFGNPCKWCGTNAAETDKVFANSSSGLHLEAGKQLCPECKGRKAIIAIPEESERRTSSGIVMSVGPEVKRLVVGDRVFYSNFAGTAIEFKQIGVARIMHEEEIQGRLWGVASLGNIVR